MYKVFIDHKPVIFIEKKEISTEFKSIKVKDLKSIKKDVKPLLVDVTLDAPLQVVCDDPKASFEEVFKKHRKITAAGGLVKRKETYLMIKRNGLWDIPKGKIDKGEDPQEAAIREVMEECGINGHEIIRPLVTTYHTMKAKGKPAIKKTEWYLMKYKGRKETYPQRNEGITKAKWMSEEHMLSMRGRTYGSINEVLDKFVQLKEERKKKKASLS